MALSVIALYKALGGGWEIRDGEDFVPAETREEMRARTYWGSLLPPETRARDVDAATADTTSHRGWRWWWPEW